MNIKIYVQQFPFRERGEKYRRGKRSFGPVCYFIHPYSQNPNRGELR
jgi:hypothetical protein